MTPTSNYIIGVLSNARQNMASGHYDIRLLENMALFIERNIPAIVGSGNVNLDYLQIKISIPPERAQQVREDANLRGIKQIIDYYNYIVISANMYMNMSHQ